MSRPNSQSDNDGTPYVPWVPTDMEWFLAELIQEHTFGNGHGPLVWVNTVLVHANSLEQAYEKALVIGSKYNDEYKNTDGDLVTVRFRGLRDLLLIYEKLEDGSEIAYTEYDEITEQEISEMVCPKEKLGAFIKHSPAKSEKSAVIGMEGQ